VGKVSEAKSGITQASARAAEAAARLELAKKRVEQYRELAATGAGTKFDLEQAESSLQQAQGQMDAARGVEAQSLAAEVQANAARDQVSQRLGAKVNGEYAQVAQIRAQLEQAKWNLDQTTVRSPCDCFVINLSLRPGAFVAALPVAAVMTLVETDGQVVALFNQNELHQVAPGNEAELALYTLPGRIIKARVDSVIWAQGAGQMQTSGNLPMTGVLAAPPQRFAVKFDIDERDREQFLAAGAAGEAAIYTDHLAMLHIIRKVILRVGSNLNYVIPKLH
jgi:multidrug resistance efflux pump